MKVHWTISIFLFLLIAGCYYDVEELLYPEEERCFEGVISYSNDIQPIVEEKCYACHGSGSTLSTVILEGYDEINKYTNDGRLVGVISHSAGYNPMPQGGAKLPDCSIEKIEIWVQNGAPNN